MSYRVSLTLNRPQMVDLINQGWMMTAGAKIEPIDMDPKVDDSAPAAPSPAAPVKKERAPRGSKVEAAINKALASGPKPTKELKAALEDAGLNPNSFGATSSKMQKAGMIKRDADGNWTQLELPLAAE